MAADAGSPAVSKAPLAQRPTVDPDWLADHTKRMIGALRWVFKRLTPEEILKLPETGAVGQYLKYYEVHTIVVARMLASIQKAQPVEDASRAVKANLDDYLATASDFVRRVRRDVPPSPWANIPAAQALLVALGAPILARDAEFKAAWNTYLGVFQLLVENTTAVGRYLGEQGAEITRTLPGTLDELRKTLDEVSVKFSFDVVVKEAYKKQLDLLWLEGEKVSPAAAAVRDATAELQRGPLLEARRAQRL